MVSEGDVPGIQPPFPCSEDNPKVTQNLQTLTQHTHQKNILIVLNDFPNAASLPSLEQTQKRGKERTGVVEGDVGQEKGKEWWEEGAKRE